MKLEQFNRLTGHRSQLTRFRKAWVKVTDPESSDLLSLPSEPPDHAEGHLT